MAIKMNNKNTKSHKDKDNWEPKKIAFRLDIGMLNNIVGYVIKQSPIITRKSLGNMRHFFEILDVSIYENNDKLYERIKFIQRALYARTKLSIENRSLIVDYCTTNSEENGVIIKNLHRYERLSYDELIGINKMIMDRIKYYFIITYKDQLYNAIERIDRGDYDSYQEINNEVVNISKKLIGKTREANIVNQTSSFSLDNATFDQNVTDIVKKLKDPARIMKTGIRAWNEILVKGYRSKRLYLYMGLPGGYKSWILLKSAVDIKKYNQGLQGRKEGSRKTILLVTMENDVEETVERLFNLTVTGDDIRDFTPEEVVKMLREEGQMTLNDGSEIDIVIQYYPNRSISTDDLYTIMEDLEDDNREIIALILDYIKRIRPAEHGKDEKEELKNVTNELKTIATEKDIPVISAHQLNRGAATIVDAGIEGNKEDITRQIGRSNVGSAWEVMENCDWVCIINIERKRDTGQFYLTFKRVKIRYKYTSELSYFNHPFASENGIQLIDDVNLEEGLSELTLSTDFEGGEVVTKKGKRSAVEREIVDDDEASNILDFSLIRSSNQILPDKKAS